MKAIQMYWGTICVEDIYVTYRWKKELSRSSSEEREKKDRRGHTRNKYKRGHEEKKLIKEGHSEREILRERKVIACLIYSTS